VGVRGQQLVCSICPHRRYSSIVLLRRLPNALLAPLDGLRLLAPAALLGDVAKAFDAFLSKAFGTPRDEERGAATA
jgi:hypothetical protein